MQLFSAWYAEITMRILRKKDVKEGSGGLA
jgi:hypothetical protein